MTATEGQQGQTSSQVILTLGDGDFTFTLDLARNLKSAAHQPDGHQATLTTLVATGIDSVDDLNSKYRDFPFVKRTLLSLDSPELNVHVQHDVNAIDPGKHRTKIPAANKVVFNHPHLGTEDAKLHAAFLCHLFHSVRNHWLVESPGGYFYLTLAKGQFERWKCLEAAEKHRMVMVDRHVFQPPALVDGDKPYYELRRHQTGKSFKGRTIGQSETFIFARNDDESKQKHRPCWFGGESQSESMSLQCPFCSKSFREDRSIQSHIRSKHPDGSKRKREVDTFTCSKCSPRRVFESAQALEEHSLVKHAAIHKDIRPDWYRPSSDAEAASAPSRDFGTCDICSLAFQSQPERDNHMQIFVPADSTSIDEKLRSYCCEYCQRTFREKRAKLQHENRCGREKSSVM